MAKIQNPQDQNGINLVNQETFETEVTRLERIDTELLGKINDETNRAIIAEETLSDRITSIEGTIDFNTQSEQPSDSVQWIAMEFSLESSLNNIINKEIRSITINSVNTVTTPHFLGIFDTRTNGIKKILGISKATTWNAGESVIFKFEYPVTVKGKFELFLLSEPVSEDFSNDLPKPDAYIESYVSSGNQNYRKPDGTWANNNKRSFYLTFNFIGDRIGTLEEIVEDHLVDNELHITMDERDSWNKASTDSSEALSTIQKYISTDGILNPASESVTLSDTTNVVFNLSNDDNIILVSYTPHITVDIDSTVSIDNNQITFTLSKKDTTQIGENYFVLEVIYIDKNFKQVKRAFSYITLNIE